MAGREPGEGAVPGGRDESGDEGSSDPACRFPDEVWRKFLADTESAIRESAPREPSARERTGTGAGTPPSAASAATNPAAAPAPPVPPVLLPSAATAGDRPGDSVGELWQRAEAGSAPSWRELDRRGRLLRLGRVLGAVAAVAAMVGLMSWLPSSSDTPSRKLRETAVRQTVESPGAQSTTRTLPARLSETGQPSATRETTTGSTRETTRRTRQNRRSSSSSHGTRVQDD